jgi:DEAD/DEAH box helicase domain-containing protein
MLLTTATGVDGNDYDLLEISDSTTPVRGEPSASGAWQEIIDQVQPALTPGLAVLARMGAALPEVGTELADDKGRVIADAELTWGEMRVVLLRPDQSDLAEIWHAQTWVVRQLDQSLTRIEDQPWALAVAIILGLKNNKE